MLIINESDAGERTILSSAFTMRCRQVVLRIAAYKNRISNRIYACLIRSNPFSPPT
jgi:hypothetical protein